MTFMETIPHIDRGDFLTFASIGQGLGMPYDIQSCEVSPGVWRRHPDLKVSESRSDISRDGYIGLIFFAITQDRKDILDRIISAGWKRRWKMGDRGKSAYTNIWPLVPYLYAARYGAWVPTPYLPIVWKAKTGFRAHLFAMLILIDILIGKRYNKHQRSIRTLWENNKGNNLFRALYRLEYLLTEYDYEWGGCPPEIHRRLAEFTKGVVK